MLMLANFSFGAGCLSHGVIIVEYFYALTVQKQDHMRAHLQFYLGRLELWPTEFKQLWNQ